MNQKTEMRPSLAASEGSQDPRRSNLPPELTGGSEEDQGWVPLPTMQSLYEVNRRGIVRSLPRVIWNGRGYYTQPPRIISERNSWAAGYRSVSLTAENGRRLDFLVHRAIALAFVPNPDSKPHVNHKNGDRSDNRIENLEWVTHSENIQHAYRVLGHRVKGVTGQNNKMSKLTDTQRASLTDMEKTMTHQQIADMFGMKKCGVSAAIKRLNK